MSCNSWTYPVVAVAFHSGCILALLNVYGCTYCAALCHFVLRISGNNGLESGVSFIQVNMILPLLLSPAIFWPYVEENVIGRQHFS